MSRRSWQQQPLAVPNDAKLQQQITALQNIVEQHQGRINTVDQRSARTRDQMQKAQQLEASKQAIVSSWSDSAGPQERMKAIADIVAKQDSLRGKYASTTTLRTKSGWSHFSIVEFFTRSLERLSRACQEGCPPRSRSTSVKLINLFDVQSQCTPRLSVSSSGTSLHGR